MTTIIGGKPGYKVSEDTIKKMRQQRTMGISRRQVARALGVSELTVQRYTDDIKDRQRTGFSNDDRNRFLRQWTRAEIC